MDRILGWYRIASSTGAVVALNVANAIPQFGAVFLGWNFCMILIVSRLENGVVGDINNLKILRAESGADSTSAWRMNGKPMALVSRSAIAGFFLIHYGMFWFVHGVFVLTMPLFAGMGGLPDVGPAFSGEGPFVNGVFEPEFGGGASMARRFDLGGVLLAVIALAISHGLSFWFNYLGRGEYKRASAIGQMFTPYGRLVVLHITIIVGGLAIALTGAPAAALAILVVLKTLMDIAFHLAEHRKRALPPGTVAPA
jgi:hypothetical protein